METIDGEEMHWTSLIRRPRVTRRTFLKHSVTVSVALGIMAGRAASRDESGQPAGGMGSGPRGQTKVIDCHAHLNHRSRSTWEADDRKLIEAADKLGIDQLCCSVLTRSQPATADGFRECNQWMAEAMRRFPGRVLGYCYVNPGYGQEALEEILLKVFEEYRASKHRSLKVFRTEAVRAGFKSAYDRQDYKTIVEVARRLPETVLQEDEKLLMYYDVATMRLGDHDKHNLF